MGGVSGWRIMASGRLEGVEKEVWRGGIKGDMRERGEECRDSVEKWLKKKQEMGRRRERASEEAVREAEQGSWCSTAMKRKGRF